MDDVLISEVDVSEEQDAWTRIVGSLETLDSYYDEIAKSGGIDRDQARVLVEECGVMMQERYPINSFTEVASRTNFSVAMESIIDRNAQLLVELLKKAAEILLKILRWVLDLVTARRARSQQTARKTLSIQAVDQANRDLREAGVENVMEDDGGKGSVAASSIVTTAVETYEANFNDLVADLLTSGRFTGMARELSHTVFEFAPLLRDKLMLFDKVLRTNVRHGDVAGNTVEISELRTIAMPIPITSVKMLMQRGGVDVRASGEGKPTLSDAMRRLFDIYQQLRLGREYDPVDIRVVADYLSATNSRVVTPFFLAPDEIAKSMREITQELQRIHSFEPSKVAPVENREAFQAAVAVLTEEVNALRMFIAVIEGCSAMQDRLVDDIWRFETAQLQYYRAKAGASNNSALVDQVNQIQRELGTALRRFG